jgi:hypothetical protein
MPIRDEMGEVGEVGDDENYDAVVPTKRGRCVPRTFSLSIALKPMWQSRQRVCPIGFAVLIFSTFPTPTQVPELARP